MAIKTLLVEDHQIVRVGLHKLLDAEETIEVVAEAQNGREALALAKAHDLDLVIMDVEMPSLNGVDATQQLLEAHPRLKVIALSMHTERPFVLGMMEAGASGYVLKDAAWEELVHAIELVMAGQTYLSPKVQGVVVESYRGLAQGSGADAPERLSPREREVVQLLAEGLSTKQIAEQLHLSPKTVETHRSRVMSKLDISNVAQLIRYAIREGITSRDA
ncbi:MAG: response regulator [Armatimonadia bacterium]|nr:response regulator [Armatimonadia bacterium]